MTEVPHVVWLRRRECGWRREEVCFDTSSRAITNRELWKVSPRQRVSLFVGPTKYLKEIALGNRNQHMSQSPKARRLIDVFLSPCSSSKAKQTFPCGACNL
jgi:hypothetical protein